MSDIKITEIVYSYREDVEMPTTVDNPTDSTVKSYLVAHATYEYGNHEVGYVDADLLLIATKTYDSDGNVTVVAGEDPLPAPSEVIDTLTALIESKISSKNQELYYRNLLENTVGTAVTTLPYYGRDSLTLEELRDKYCK